MFSEEADNELGALGNSWQEGKTCSAQGVLCTSGVIIPNTLLYSAGSPNS